MTPRKTAQALIEPSHPAGTVHHGSLSPAHEVSGPSRRGTTRKVRVLVVRSHDAPMISVDIELLRRRHEVRVVDAPLVKHRPIQSAVSIARLALLAAWADVIFVWFADLHAYFAVRLGRLLSRPSVVVIGGYEVADHPEIGYGLFADPVMAPYVASVLRQADRILAVDDGLLRDGERHLNERLPTWRVVPTGYDPVRFSPSGAKEEMVLTVFGGDDIGRARLKGVDTFIGAASRLPALKFVVIGVRGEAEAWLRQQAPPNVELLPLIEQERLIDYFRRAKVYAQLSLREGLPNAVCEAMLCECVPVGTPVQGIETAMGPIGFYTPVGDPAACADAIAQAMESGQGPAARARIAALFPLERRATGLLELIDELMAARP